MGFFTFPLKILLSLLGPVGLQQLFRVFSVLLQRVDGRLGCRFSKLIRHFQPPRLGGILSREPRRRERYREQRVQLCILYRPLHLLVGLLLARPAALLVALVNVAFRQLQLGLIGRATPPRLFSFLQCMKLLAKSLHADKNYLAFFRACSFILSSSLATVILALAPVNIPLSTGKSGRSSSMLMRAEMQLNKLKSHFVVLSHLC
jgi:hypothetical protein